MFSKILASSGYSEIGVLKKVHVMLCYEYVDLVFERGRGEGQGGVTILYRTKT